MRLLAFIAILMLTIVSATAVLAQEGTPTLPGAADEAHPDHNPPVIDEPRGTPVAAASPAAEDQPNRMVLLPIEVPQGTEIQSHEHHGALVWIVEEGTLTYSIQSGDAWARCSGGCLPAGTPTVFEGEIGAERLPLDTEITLEPGDWVMQVDTTKHAYANTGDTDIVILQVRLYDPNEESFEGCQGAC
jgi:quercetin dioxygenase-like cupin family protein